LSTGTKGGPTASVQPRAGTATPIDRNAILPSSGVKIAPIRRVGLQRVVGRIE
jgi:hypothetical protein